VPSPHLLLSALHENSPQHASRQSHHFPRSNPACSIPANSHDPVCRDLLPKLGVMPRCFVSEGQDRLMISISPHVTIFIWGRADLHDIDGWALGTVIAIHEPYSSAGISPTEKLQDVDSECPRQGSTSGSEARHNATCASSGSALGSRKGYYYNMVLLCISVCFLPIWKVQCWLRENANVVLGGVSGRRDWVPSSSIDATIEGHDCNFSLPR